MFRKNGVFLIAAACVLAFGVYLVTPSFHKTVDQTSQIQTQGVSYQGQDGKTALELLRNKYDVETTKYDFGEMVTGINGVKSSSSQFWAFSVNGQMATQGADSFITKSSDTISWKLENVQ
jgi:hypothetical protein